MSDRGAGDRDASDRDASDRDSGDRDSGDRDSGDQERLGDEQYAELLAFRTALRRFLHWSDEQARSAGLTGQQHQLLLAIRGHLGPHAPTIGDVADHLMVRHHSAVGLAHRAEEAGLVQRIVDDHDRRLVRLTLTSKGRRVLDRLTAAHLEELARLAPSVRRLAAGLTLHAAD